MTNLDCTDIQALLSGFVDDELEAPVRHQAERHLADCKPCRDMVNDAESLTQMIALDAQGLMWPVGLPAGFEDAVLSQTVRAHSPMYHAGQRWTSWLGWVAAAACAVLAASIWFVDRQMHSTTNVPTDSAVTSNGTSSTGGGMAPASAGAPSHASFNPKLNRSWTYSGSLAPEVVQVTAVHMHEDTPTPAVYREIDDQLELVQSSGYRWDALSELSRSPAISAEDALTLSMASSLMETLASSNLASFAEAEQIRQAAEREQLLDKLAILRTRLAAADRPAVYMAEDILNRIVNGPIDLNDLRRLHNNAVSMELSSQMTSIRDRGEAAPTM